MWRGEQKSGFHCVQSEFKGKCWSAGWVRSADICTKHTQTASDMLRLLGSQTKLFHLRNLMHKLFTGSSRPITKQKYLHHPMSFMRHLWTQFESGLQQSPDHNSPVSVEVEKPNTEERLHRTSDDTNNSVFIRQRWMLNSKHSDQWFRRQNIYKYEFFFFLLWNSLISCNV